MAEPRRREAGEGGISEYATKAGPRFAIRYTAQREDGTTRGVLKPGFTSKREAAAVDRAGARPLPRLGGRPRPGPRHGLATARGQRDAPR